ncbi:hypothetical protein [Gordonia alkanivorans]|uniref:Uncharacterized protein n=1 Tax=Gordonia alkanivorans NBRC 16433 TaxID=1027371 RepID=F9VVF2_9ACTN|nr:hypothetical protein [Gordonia alkanivorans]GAA12581.1 hypothetical protein GOALK_056_00140 [Gordonia alkanivorans NBRC 16433]
MRYADLESHGDLGLGAEEPGMRRFTRPSERIEPTPVDSSNIELDDPSGMDLGGMFDAIEAGRCSGEDLIRTEALERLEQRIAHNWRVWEGLTEGQTRDNLAHFIHDLEDRADALTEDLRATQLGQKKGPGGAPTPSEGEVPTPTKEEN